MTARFNALYESIIHETLVGSKKRNKKPGMGRKGGRQRTLDRARAGARKIKKHAAHIRPTHKVTGNESGKHTKDPDSKPVYSKDGVKPMTNASQRSIPKSKTNRPYSSDHESAGTRRNLMARREKLVGK